MKVVKELDEFEDSSNIHLRRRMVILQRTDRYFSFAQQYYYRSEYEGKVVAEGWANLHLEGIFESLSPAEVEARSAMRRLSRIS